MPASTKSHVNLADPVRLGVLHASFQTADEEWRRRTAAPPRDDSGEPTLSAASNEATRLASALRRYLADLSLPDLNKVRTQLAQGLLHELDRKMAGPGEPPGERLDPERIPEDRPVLPAHPVTQRVGLVSLPWMSPAMPSIQLATLASALDQAGVSSDVHEIYVDYAARIGLNLYNHIGNLLGFLPEWVFSRHYYGPEHGDDLAEMIGQDPLAEIPWPEFSDLILRALEPLTAGYLDEMVEAVDWSRYDILGFSLTISQLGASMAFCRRVKRRHPGIRIVFGGSQCAGVMGNAILRVCPYVDVVAHVEGELVLPDLVGRLRAGRSLEGMPGVSYRGDDGEIVTGPPGGLYRSTTERLPLSYDSYFRRLKRLGLLNKMKPWVPFEGSRGCWYGQKIQCTFCGLHEIMEFRAWEADAVLTDLERLSASYGIGRFYAMDLILPREYLRTLLPEIAKRGHDWMFFWEIKSNMKREEVETLARAGVRWVQPGIESLDADLLSLMAKGVSPLQNIQLLKWCQELGIFCGWNLLFGLPGETAASYRRMTEIIPKLHHLKPPSGGGQFQLHRFSPYFDHPEKYGIRWTGAHPMFRYAFPIPKEDLDELVYLHEFEIASGGEPVDVYPVEAAVKEWRRAHQRGASLAITVHEDGSSLIEDAREPDSTVWAHRLSADETALYLFLDKGVKKTRLAEAFLREHPEAETLHEAIATVVERWLSDDLLVEIDGRLLSLALYPARDDAENPQHRPARASTKELAPVA